MTNRSASETSILRDLGEGLILRRARPADTDALAEFNCDIHSGPFPGDAHRATRDWIKDLMSGNHPTFAPRDFTIVEDTRAGAIVASLCLIPQVWSFDGVKVPVGLPELVGTREEYRKRGLVRAQFEVIHELSAQRRHKLQAIAGIPYFYRQFGYDMPLELEGGRTGFISQAPTLKRGEKEAYLLRPATEGDLPFISRVYREGMKRYLVSAVRNRALWRWELTGRRRAAMERRELRVIETAKGERVGFLAHKAVPWLWGNAFGAEVCELKPGVSWLAVTPSVVRYLVTTGKKYAARANKELRRFSFWLGSEHPVYHVIPSLLVDKRPPYSFYIRVPDLPDFLAHIAPALERRLAESVAVGHTGELKLNFYRGGLRLVFRRGRLTQAVPWRPGGGSSAGFPNLTFLQLLFGRQSLEELRGAHPDCYASSDEAELLLEVLFPKRPSSVWTVV
ncbi:MAG: GNAT family N-acetyltransferase [Proteobacteria bacterium]|nr:GNAT family N-acetyltransferase [Pseudomonadota bacterium]